jgi:hypothetical protein
VDEEEKQKIIHEIAHNDPDAYKGLSMDMDKTYQKVVRDYLGDCTIKLQSDEKNQNKSEGLINNILSPIKINTNKCLKKSQVTKKRSQYGKDDNIAAEEEQTPSKKKKTTTSKQDNSAKEHHTHSKKKTTTPKKPDQSDDRVTRARARKNEM